MTDNPRALIVEENNAVPLDTRVWYEATTLRDAGWHVTVVCPYDPVARGTRARAGRNWLHEELEGVEIYRFPLCSAEHGIKGYLREYLVAFAHIARLSWHVWRTRPFDSIHFCNPPDIFFPIALLYRVLGAAVVFDHHDLFPELVAWRYEHPVAGVLHAISRVTEYLSFRCAHIIVSTNESYRQVALGRGRVPSERVIVVRNGPKRGEFVPVEPEPVLKGEFSYMVCYAGIMGHQDGVLELVESIRHIVQKLDRTDILFALLGDGAVRAQALATISDWELDRYVHMPGMIRDNETLRRYLCTADLCVSPEPLNGLNNRSTFIKIGEYMAMGKPVLAYDLVESRRTARDAAHYVRPGDSQAFGEAVVALLDNPAQRKQMGEAGKKRVNHQLCWEHQRDNLLRAYAIAQQYRRPLGKRHSMPRLPESMLPEADSRNPSTSLRAMGTDAE